MKITIFFVFCTLGLLGSSDAQESQGLSTQPNAALQYWQAYGYLPDLGPLASNRVRNFLVTGIDSSSLPDSIKNLDAEAPAIEAFLEASRNGTRCEWDPLPYTKGADFFLGYQPRILVLVYCALLSAENEFHKGNDAVALELLKASHQLAGALGCDDPTRLPIWAHHIGENPSLTILGYQYEAEKVCLNIGVRNLIKKKQEVRRDYLRFLGSLPAFTSIADRMKGQKFQPDLVRSYYHTMNLQEKEILESLIAQNVKGRLDRGIAQSREKIYSAEEIEEQVEVSQIIFDARRSNAPEFNQKIGRAHLAWEEVNGPIGSPIRDFILQESIKEERRMAKIIISSAPQLDSEALKKEGVQKTVEKLWVIFSSTRVGVQEGLTPGDLLDRSFSPPYFKILNN